jgi:hypothetical protein
MVINIAEQEIIKKIHEIVAECKFPGYTFEVFVDGRGEIYLQARYLENDVVTKEPATQLTRRWFLSPFMTKSEIVQTVFKCVITSMEHKTREWFTYMGYAIFCPHFDVDALWEIAKAGHFDRRKRG